jgi:hypothetical protein
MISNIYDEVKMSRINSCCMDIQTDVNKEFLYNKKYNLNLSAFKTIDFKIDYIELNKNCISIDNNNIKSLNIYFDRIIKVLLKNDVRLIVSKSHEIGQKNIVVKIHIEFWE